MIGLRPLGQEDLLFVIVLDFSVDVQHFNVALEHISVAAASV